MTSPATLRRALDHLESLPAVPSIALKILALKITTDEGERALLELIGQDPSILSRIIGLANSPLFGTSRKILKLQDAAAVLGIKRIKMVSLGFAMMNSLTRKPAGLLDLQGLWQHSLSVAMTMDSIARLMPGQQRPPDEEIYLAGLLHDIGFLVLDYLDPELSDRFHARLIAEPGCPVAQVEDEMLETSHGELGAALGRRWNLPESIVTVLHYHHTPRNERAAVEQPLVDMVNLAEKLLPTFGIAEPVAMDIDDEEWLALGIDPSRLEELKTSVQEHVQKVAAIYT